MHVAAASENRNYDATIVAGAHFGDEAKGATALRYALAEGIDVVVRAGGGPNCGHEGEYLGKRIKAHSIPLAGVLPRRRAVIGGESLILPNSPTSLLDSTRRRIGLPEEHARLQAAGFEDFTLLIDGRCQLILRPHMELELANEAGPYAVGSTGTGISIARVFQGLRAGLRVAQLLDEHSLHDALEQADWYRRELFSRRSPGTSFLNCYADLMRFRNWLLQADGVQVVDTDQFLYEEWRNGNALLYEMPQAYGLDTLRGTGRFVTTSFPMHPTGVWVPSGSVRTILVSKAGYMTRVGMGPFITRHPPELEEELRRDGGELGVTTGRNRDTGDYDVVHARMAVRACHGEVRLNLSKLDVVRGKRGRACLSYRHKRTGEVITAWPLDTSRLHDYEPHDMVDLPWFTEDVSKARHWDDLPQAARELVLVLEQLINVDGTPRALLDSVSVGPGHDQLIWRPRS